MRALSWLLGSVLLLELTACRRRDTTKPTADATAALRGPRTIPLRIVQMVHACRRCDPARLCSAQESCSPAECEHDLLDVAQVQARVNEASQTYARAGIRFEIGSLEKIAMPGLIDTNDSTPVRWAEVRSDVRQALPSTPCQAWPDQAVATRRDWLMRASTRYAPPELVPMFVTSTPMGGHGVYPWRGRVLLIDKNQINRHRETNMLHELGHFLGLPHSFQSVVSFGQNSYNLERGTVRNPQTRSFLRFADFWDLVLLPANGFSFFPSPEAIRPEAEPGLQGIEWWDLPGTYSNCKIDAATCVYQCQLPGGAGVLSTGDPRLRGLAFETIASDGSRLRGINIMDYIQSPSCMLNGLADSQIAQLRRVLEFDLPLDDQALYPGGTGLRPRLGMAPPMAAAHLDVDFDHIPEPLEPARLVEHPAWDAEVNEGPVRMTGL